MTQVTLAGTLAILGAAWVAAQQPPGKVLFHEDFERAELGKVPTNLLVLDGAFQVKTDGTNRFLWLPGAPVDAFKVLFGPSQKDGVAVTARLYSTRRGRRYPALVVGLNGAGGYELQLAPAKKALELFKAEQRLLSVPATWEPGTWTWLRLQVRRVGPKAWKIEGKAWPQGAPEPAQWMIAYDEAEEPPSGRALIAGYPFAETAIQFDDLLVTAVAEQSRGKR